MSGTNSAIPLRQGGAIITFPNRKVNRPLKFRLTEIHWDHPFLTQHCKLTPATIIHFGLAYCYAKRGIMAGHIIIPIHNANGELVAYSGLRPEMAFKGKFEYTTASEFRKSNELFNFHRAISEPRNTPMLVVNDIFELFKMHQVGYRKVVATMDEHISHEQRDLLKCFKNMYPYTVRVRFGDDVCQSKSENAIVHLV